MKTSTILAVVAVCGLLAACTDPSGPGVSAPAAPALQQDTTSVQSTNTTEPSEERDGGPVVGSGG